MSIVNIAENEESVFIIIEKNELDDSQIKEVNDFLWELYHAKLGIPAVTSEEQAEIEHSLNDLSEEERKIVKRKTIKFKM
jgi:hypothetical protein